MISLNASGGRDHSVDRAMFLLNWSATMLYFPCMCDTVSVHPMLVALLHISSEIIAKWYTVVVLLRTADTAVELSHSMWIIWFSLVTFISANQIVTSSNVFIE